ncbi:hypothetical protein VP01_2091g2 [Puccinia sorghi]|uniref:Uncharacterized protein n=1 Tax=Puccinia sorghi TaxID=27349 RepID=A0A0L6VAW3_9BASI|nr:hypothetical protein VP01_2091g2 [Puccinia sorghi]
MPVSNIAVHHEGYSPLQISEVKDRAENIPEEALINYLETIPQFSKQKSTIFTGLDQKYSMKYDYVFIKDSLNILGKKAHQMHSIFKPNFRKLSANIQHLKDFNKLLTQGTKEILYKAKDQGGHAKTMEISTFKQKGLAARLKAIFQISENDVSPSILNSDVVGIIRKIVWDGQIERLNAILHDLDSLKDKEENRFSTINILIHKLQRNIFQTVDYMYKQEMISEKALVDFFRLKNTFELAALNMYFNPEIDRVSDFWDRIYRNKNPISTLNRWDCSNYRTLYEAEIL